MAPRALILTAACGGCLMPTLAAGCLEDATVLVQSQRPGLFGGLFGGRGAGAGDEEEEGQKTGGMGALLRTLALGAQAEDEATAKMLSSAGEMMDTIDRKTPAPQQQEGGEGDALNKMASGLQDWGSKMKDLFDKSKAKSSQDATEGTKDLLTGVGHLVSQALPEEVRERAEKVRVRAARAKGRLANLTSMLRNPPAATPESAAKATQAAEALGELVKKHLEHTASDPNSRGARRMKELTDLFKEAKDEDKDRNPMSGINEMVSGLRQALHFDNQPQGSAPTAAAPAASEPAAAAAPEQPAAPAQQQMASQAPPPQFFPAQPQQATWQQFPGMQPYMGGPMAYPMPPMMQQPPMGGMQPYPMGPPPQMR
mmetsp:Transcript_80127/g.248674  ORF Transcript_80127/g.248674 Transcript_80127/m.248674 type:complete len:369 (+) Transcript_80127:85-1191(+)